MGTLEADPETDRRMRQHVIDLVHEIMGDTATLEAMAKALSADATAQSRRGVRRPIRLCMPVWVTNPFTKEDISLELCITELSDAEYSKEEHRLAHYDPGARSVEIFIPPREDGVRVPFHLALKNLRRALMSRPMVHEIVHFVDDLRSDVSMSKWPGVDPEKDYRGYLNTGHEFNANFQQAMTTDIVAAWNAFVAETSASNARRTPFRDFEEFALERSEVLRNLRENLKPKYLRKFDQRLYQTWKHLVERLG